MVQCKQVERMECILEGKDPLEESQEDLEEGEKEMMFTRQDLFQGELKETPICVLTIFILRKPSTDVIKDWDQDKIVMLIVGNDCYADCWQ